MPSQLTIIDNEGCDSMITYSGKNLSSTQVRNSYIRTASDVTAGYLGGKAFDTNTNPSNLQTMGTVVASGLVGSLVYNLALKQMLGDTSGFSDLVIDDDGNSVYPSNFANIALRLAGGYHGYKRNGDNIGYGLLWALFGSATSFGLALEQGYAEPIDVADPRGLPTAQPRSLTR